MNPISRGASHEYSAIEFWISAQGSRPRPARNDEQHDRCARIEESRLPRYTATAPRIPDYLVFGDYLLDTRGRHHDSRGESWTTNHFGSCLPRGYSSRSQRTD